MRATSPTKISLNAGVCKSLIAGIGHPSHALITLSKPVVRLITQFLSVEVLTFSFLEPAAITDVKLSILAVNTVAFNAPLVPMCFSQRSFTIALNLQSPKIPLQPDFPLPVHQKGVGKESE